MTDPDPLAIALEVGGILDDLGVRYSIGGSLASSVHGLARATLDADLVADLRPGQGRPIAERLAPTFYADADAIERAIVARNSFNLIHLASMFKVDVFVLKRDPFSRESFLRSRAEPLGPDARPVLVTRPEDTVLHKLVWFEKGGGVSERQWSDVVGVLRIQGERIDRAYLERWAETLGLEDLLSRALEESELGLGP